MQQPHASNKPKLEYQDRRIKHQWKTEKGEKNLIVEGKRVKKTSRKAKEEAQPGYSIKKFLKKRNNGEKEELVEWNESEKHMWEPLYELRSM